MGLLDKLNKLIIGSGTTKDLDRVKSSLNRLKKIHTSTEIVTFSELVKAIYDDKTSSLDSSKQNDIYSNMQAFMKEIGLDFNDVRIENDRLSRYKEYDAIIRKIPYMKRALKVIKQNVLNPEDYTKQSIQVYLKDNIQKSTIENYEKYEKEFYDYINDFELETYIDNIVYNTLKFGDFFVEVIVLPEVLKKYKILHESFLENKSTIINETIKIQDDNDEKNINLKINLENMYTDTKFYKEDYDDSTNAKSRLKDNLKNMKLSKSDIYLDYIPPHRVVRLGDRFCFGFIVLKEISTNDSMLSSGSGISAAAEKISKQGNIEKIVKKIMQKIVTNPDQIRQSMEKTESDLKFTLARFLATYMGKGNTQQNAELNLRFVPTELMEHFYIDKSEFSPYGTSIFYGSEFLAKVVVAIQSSIMLQRLSRSVEKRVIRVDIGATRDARRYITEVKNQFNRKRFSAGNNGTVDEIPASLSTFEDIYIPVQNGKTPVEFDTLPPVGDISSRVDDLKSLRDALVASIDVPPPYIGIEENTESKAQLTQENVVFSASIINYQKAFSNRLTSLIQKVLSIIISDQDKLNTMNNFVLSFDPPTSIIMEHKSEYLQNVSTVIENLSNLGISKSYLIDKFVPQLKSWQQESAKIEEALEKVYNKSDNGNEEQGGFGSGDFGSGGESGGF